MLHFLQAASDFSLLFRFMWSSWRRFASVINLQPKPHGVLPFSIRLGNKEQSGAAGQYLEIGGSSLWPVSLLFYTRPHIQLFFRMGPQCIHGLRCHDKPVHTAYA